MTVTVWTGAPPDLAALQRTVQRARTFAHFRAKYEGLALATLADFLRFPLMGKADLAACFAELEAAVRRGAYRGYVVATGGTTSAPRLSLIPPHLFVGDITAHWRPLDVTDVVCNLFRPSKLWGAHYFYNALGEALAGEIVPLGHIEPDETPTWADFMHSRHVTALAGVPTSLRQLLAFFEHDRRPRPPVAKLLWVGERFGDELTRLADAVFPAATTWGLYGSVETWPIAYNFPECPLDTFHVLPYQVVEIEDGEVVVTNVHSHCINVLVRYRTGDAATWQECRCGRGAPALALHGRTDDTFKFRAILVSAEELLHPARAVPGVADAQLAIVGAGADGKENLEIRVVAGDPGGDIVATANAATLEYLRTRIGVNNILASDPRAIRVVRVDALEISPRTNKTAVVVRADAAGARNAVV